MNQIIVFALVLCLFPVKSYSEEKVNHSIDGTRSDFYVGFDIFTGDSDRKLKINTTPYKDGHDQTGYRLLAGKIFKQGFRLEAYYANENLDMKGDPFLSLFEKEIISIGANVIKAFDVDRIFQPYFVLGFVSSRTQLSDPDFDFSSSSLRAAGFKLGAGLYFQVKKNTEFKLGAALQKRSWQDIEPEGSDTLITVDDEGVTIYAGVNVHF